MLQRGSAMVDLRYSRQLHILASRLHAPLFDALNPSYPVHPSQEPGHSLMPRGLPGGGEGVGVVQAGPRGVNLLLRSRLEEHLAMRGEASRPNETTSSAPRDQGLPNPLR
jgi:hypothetical protein